MSTRSSFPARDAREGWRILHRHHALERAASVLYMMRDD